MPDSSSRRFNLKQGASTSSLELLRVALKVNKNMLQKHKRKLGQDDHNGFCPPSIFTLKGNWIKKKNWDQKLCVSSFTSQKEASNFKAEHTTPTVLKHTCKMTCRLHINCWHDRRVLLWGLCKNRKIKKIDYFSLVYRDNYFCTFSAGIF